MLSGVPVVLPLKAPLAIIYSSFSTRAVDIAPEGLLNSNWDDIKSSLISSPGARPSNTAPI